MSGWLGRGIAYEHLASPHLSTRLPSGAQAGSEGSFQLSRVQAPQALGISPWFAPAEMMLPVLVAQ